ncbi:hypothetical protein [Polyangium sorediatum]|uniref:Lipoprotein n=1 Tax=Polyangium sorediatum TaxID=889274 RepID=A0ABT6NP44_9BACT|nr:hypothetical protein [Polyangium sorediatum]MDI1430101.1 hypothetical protein [Polyangium sorediatum]
MNTKVFPLLLAVSLSSLAACSTVRETTPLVYAGNDGRSTVSSIEASIQKRGYKPICSKREYCKFQYNPEVWVHYKTSSDRVVMAVDVVNGKKMAADKRKALTDEASAVGEAIWREASEDALQRERVEAEKEKAEAVARAEAERKEKEEEERKAAEAKASGNGSSSGGGLGGFLGAAADVLGSVKVTTGPGQGNGGGAGSGQSNASAHCCVNGSYYQCPSASAVNKCAGESAACLSRCMSSSDMSCGERCMKEHPPDPSACERRSDKDGECR